MAYDDNLLENLTNALRNVYKKKVINYFTISTQYHNEKTQQNETYTGDFLAQFDGQAFLIQSYNNGHGTCINVSLNYENGSYRWDGNILANSQTKQCFKPVITKGNADILSVLKAKFAECIIAATEIETTYQIADEATLPANPELGVSLFNIMRNKPPIYQKYGFTSDFNGYDNLVKALKVLQFQELAGPQQNLLTQRFGPIHPQTLVFQILGQIPINDPLERSHDGLGPISSDIFFYVYEKLGFSEYQDPGQENSPFTFNFGGFDDNWQNKVLVTELAIYAGKSYDSITYKGTYLNPQNQIQPSPPTFPYVASLAPAYYGAPAAPAYYGAPPSPSYNPAPALPAYAAPSSFYAPPSPGYYGPPSGFVAALHNDNNNAGFSRQRKRKTRAKHNQARKTRRKQSKKHL